MTFSEAVNVTSFNASALVLMSFFEQPEEEYRLSSEATGSVDGAALSISLSRTDIDQLKVMELLCLRRSNCYIRADAGLIDDLSGNPSTEIPEGESSAIVVSFLAADSVSPTLTGFNFNLNEGNLTLSFDEPVSLNSFDPTAITLQSGRGSLGSVENYQLTGGTAVAQNNFKTLVVQLTNVDINAIKARSSLAINDSTTFISLGSGLVEDLATTPNSLTPITPTNARAVTNYTADTTEPTLLSFQLDVNEDRLLLTFSEPVRKSTFNVAGLTIHSHSNSSDPSDSPYSLSTNSTVRTPATDLGSVFILSLSQNDIGDIKIDTSVGTNTLNTYLEIVASSARDRAGNPISSEYIQVSNVIQDTIRPELLSFTLDIATGVMTMTFNDVVDTDTFDATAFTLQDALARQNSFTFSTSTDTSSNNGYAINVQLSSQDLLGVKLTTNLAKTINTTYLTMQAFAIDDIGGTDVLAITDGKAIQARQYFPDETPPILTNFSLDLNTGTLELTFDEAVNESSIDITGLLLQSASSSPIASLRLTDYDSIQANSDSSVHNITIPDSLLNAIKEDTSLAISAATTYLQTEAGFINDYSFNSIEAKAATIVDTYTPDTTSPELVSFAIDFDAKTLTLNFSEALSSFNPLNITLQPNMNSTGVISQTRTLNSSTSTRLTSTDYLVTLSTADLNAINAIPQLATGIHNTYISITTDGATDYNSNSFRVLPIGSGQRASQYTNDETSPSITGFDLNLNTMRLILTFDEVVKASSLNFTGIILQSSVDGSGGIQHRLTGGSPPNSDSTVISASLSLADMASLVTTSGLAVTPANTYLAMDSTAITDVSGNGGNSVNRRATTAALRATSVTPDTSPPTLTSFGLNLSNRSLVLTFSEYVDLESFTYSSFVIASSNTGTPITVSIPNSEITSSQVNSSIIVIDLSATDFKQLQDTNGIGVATSNTYINISAGALRDLSGNSYESQGAIQATFVEPDSSKPELVSYSLNLGLRRLLLTFNEPIQRDTFTISGVLTVSNSNESDVASYTLTSNSTIADISPDYTFISIGLGALDYARLGADGSASSLDNTYISFTSSLAVDLIGNSIVPILFEDRIPPTEIADESLAPELLQFTIDLNSGILLLGMSEQINFDTLNITDIELQSTAVRSGSTVIKFITGGQPVSSGIADIRITMTDADLNAIKVLAAARSLASSPANTYIVAPNTTLEDNQGTPLIVIESSNAKMAAGVVPDTSPPTIDNFELDLNTGILTLVFSEFILSCSTSFSPSHVDLQNSQSSRTVNYTLTGSMVTGSCDEVDELEITLSRTDLEAIKLADLCFSSSDCFVNLPANVVTDVFARENSARTSSFAAPNTNYTSDSTSAQLFRFLVADIANGIISIEFNEPVNVSTLDITALELISDFGTGQSVTLTNGSTTDSSSGRIVTINLSTNDLDNIKLQDSLCIGTTTCLIRFDSTLIQDMAGNPVSGFTPAILDPKFSAAFTADSTPPNLIAFDLHIDNRILTLVFDEPVNRLSFTPTAVTLQGSQNTTTSQVTFTASLPISTENGRTIDVRLPNEDVQDVQAFTDLAVNRDTTWITHTASMIEDMQRIDVVPRITDVNALQVRTLFADSIPPTLIEFSEFNINDGYIILSFSEPMDTDGVSPRNITLHSSSTGGEFYTLTGYRNSSARNALKTSLQVYLTDSDVREIRLISALALGRTSTYISLASGAFEDIAGNAVNATTTRFLVESFPPDTTPPILTSFTIDMNDGILTLTFDEVVSIASLDPLFVTLHNNENETLVTSSYEITGGTPSNENNDVITLQFSKIDFDKIKSLDSLATSINNTFISITSDFVTDLSGVEVVAVNRQKASNFTADSINPFLVSYTFNLTSGSLIMEFSEYVNTSTFVPQQVTLLNEPVFISPTRVHRTLTGGTLIPNEDLRIIEWMLNDDDLNFIKEDLTFATSINNTYITLTASTVLDGNSLRLVPISTPRIADDHVGDNLPPVIESFTLDTNTGILNITFDEVIDLTTFAITRVRLVGSSGSAYQLTDGSYTMPLLSLVSVQLTNSDLNALKANTDIATSNTTTSIQPVFNLVRDTSNNSLSGSLVTKTVSTFTRDRNPPLLLSFVFNLNSETITLSFNETIDATQVNLDEIVIQKEQNTTDGLTLATASVNSSTSDTLVIALDFNTASNIKRMEDLATERSTTYISFPSTAIQDTAGNSVIAVDETDATIATRYIGDSTPPTLNSFTFNVNTDQLVLTFSEIVDIDVFNFSRVSILSDASGSINYTLTGGLINNVDNDYIVTINLTVTDRNEIKRLFYSQLDGADRIIFVRLEDQTVSDMANNFLRRIDAISTTSIIEDDTDPILLSFELIMTNGTEPLEILLHFSETIDATFQPTSVNGITLHLTSLANSTTDVSLTTGRRSTNISPNITIFVSATDLSSIRSKAPLGQLTSSTFLSLDSNAFRDMFTNFNPEIGPIGESVAGINRADLIPPSVTSFQLDMDEGVLSLTFNDTMQVGTFLVNSVALQSNQTSNAISVSLNTDSTRLTVIDGSVISIGIANGSLNDIKADTRLAISNITTYLTLSSNALDQAGNNIYDISTSNAQQSSSFIPDTSPPILSSFDLDMSVGTIIFTFDETVNASSVIPSLVSIVNEDGSITYSFSNITSSSGFSNVITFALSPGDFNRLKGTDNLAVAINNTFLDLQRGAFTDMNGNGNAPVSREPVTGFTKDEGDPNLLSYSIDMDEGILILTFDETVNTTSLNISDVILQGSANSLTLTTSTSGDTPSVEVTVNFSTADFNELKRLEICLTSDSCSLTFTSNLVSDQVGRSVVPQTSVPVSASSFTGDITPPALTEFALFNLTSGTVTLRFSETVDASSFNVTQVTLQSFYTYEATVVNYTLTAAAILTEDSTTFIFRISQHDLFTVQQMDDLCDRRQHCYIILSSLVIRDMTGILNSEVQQVSPGFIPSRFIFDTARPRLNDFDLDMDTGLLTLSFSEPIMADSLNTTAITVVSTSNASLADRYTLTGGTTNASNGDIVVHIQLTQTDINALKVTDFAKSAEDTYLSITSSLVSDVAIASNPVIAIPLSLPLRVNNYTDDTSPPRLNSFRLDLTEDQLLLTFDEPVLTDSVVIGSLVLQDSETFPKYITCTNRRGNRRIS